MTMNHARAYYGNGLDELERYFRNGDETALRHAADRFRLAATLDPDVPTHWVALGFALDAAGLADGAMSALQRAAELDPEDHEVAVFILTLHSESGPEPEALAAVDAVAERRGIDLESLRRELTDVGMPCDACTLVQNAFIHPRNFIRSRLEDDIDLAQRNRDPEGWHRRRMSEQDGCSEMQHDLGRSVDPARVPASFRVVSLWASRLGVGDDSCRTVLLGRLTELERAEWLGIVAEHAPSIHAWLDGFGDGPMSPEANAFMYMLLGIEEASGAT